MGRTDGSDRQVTVGEADDSGAGILHVDMDAFFASVELLDHPEARGKPAIVGHATGRSIVTSATYEARRFGVRAAMPVMQALRLCPTAIVLEPHYHKYREYSERVMQVFHDVTPLVEPISIDEAFLDVRGARRRLGGSARIAALIRERVREQTGLTCSVGAAHTKYLAKLASSRAKPDGLLVVPESEALAFLHPLPVSALWGVGEKTQAALARYGLRTVADIAESPLRLVQQAVGDAAGSALYDLARGLDPRRVTPRHIEKSVGHENTFEFDIVDVGELQRELLRLSTKTGERLRALGLEARTISVKLRYSDFRTITRSRTIPEPTSVSKRIHAEAVEALMSIGLAGEPVRLVGVRAEQLVPAGGVAPSLWDPDDEWRVAERALDGVSARFGADAVRPASLIGERRRRVGEHYR